MSSRLLASLALVLTLASATQSQTPPGACQINDTAFNTQEGGCKDLTSSLVWSALYRVNSWQLANAFAEDLVEGGYSDWRLPTLVELQAAAANGAGTHLNGLGAGAYHCWSSTPVSGQGKGKYAKFWAVDIVSGQAVELIGSLSRILHFCVRQGNSGPSSASSNASGVTHFLENGKWTALVSLPAHSLAPYCMLVVSEPKSAARQPALSRIAAGTGLLATARSSAIMTSVGALDAQGRAALVVDARGLGLPASTLRKLSILLVVGDVRSPEPALYRLRLPAERASSGKGPAPMASGTVLIRADEATPDAKSASVVGTAGSVQATDLRFPCDEFLRTNPQLELIHGVWLVVTHGDGQGRTAAWLSVDAVVEVPSRVALSYLGSCTTSFFDPEPTLYHAFALSSAE